GIKECGEAGSNAAAATVIEDEISRYLEDNPLLYSVSLVNSSGTVIAGTNKDKDYPNYASYADYKDGVLYFDEPARESNGTDTTMFIKTKMSKATLFISYCLSGENSILGRFASATSFYNQGSIAIIDPNSRWSSGSTINDTLEKQFTTTVTEKIASLENNVSSEIINFNGTNGDTDGVLVRVGGEDGLVALVYCPTSRTGFYSGKSLTPIVTFTVLLSIVSFVAALIISKVVTKPLGNIEETLAKILRGDHEARIGTISNNEYGQMSRAFNNVVDEIVVSEDRYRVISEMSDNIIFEWNFKTNDVLFSNNFNKKFSYRPPSDHFGDSFLMKAKLHPEDADRYRTDLDQLEKGKNFENNEYRIQNIYGDYIWILIRTATLKDADGKPMKAVGVMVDIDRAKKSEAKLTEQASFDALTELYNRETIESQIDNEIALSEMRQSEMAVLFIDVDDFKHFNDNYSHATGDQVLKFLARTIKEAVDGIGFAGRYGGDEFIAMIR
ncbi:MAG: diguanylate cyclase, partial [Oscillospiraceae bacterium]|nr:diguanylate cyclase [Oscillospiraceae bacterium]